MAKNNGIPENVKDAGDKVQELAREAYKKADGTRKDAVKKLFEVADELRAQARETSGEARDNVNDMARNLERAANYLNSRTVDQVEEAKDTASNNPLKSTVAVLIVGIIIGLLLGRK